MPDLYDAFSELSRHEKAGRDYEVLARTGRTGIAVMAPHGGRIEPGTDVIADAIAGNEHSFFAFRGIKKSGNAALHMTSTRFDEPVATRILEHTHIAVVIHGSRDRGERIDVGGLHEPLAEAIMRSLGEKGLKAGRASAAGMKGVHPKNLCNRCQTGKGVQLEVSRGIRDLFPDGLFSSFLPFEGLAAAFVEGVREVLSCARP